MRAPNDLIQKFIQEKADWITRTREKLKEFAPREPRKFTDGESFLFLGSSFDLKLVKPQRPSLQFEHGFTLSQTMQATETDHLLAILTQKGPTVAFGMFVIATVFAAVGYLFTSFGWRWWIGRKRAQRLAEARMREPAG